MSTANVMVKNVNDAPVAEVIVTPATALSEGTVVTLDGSKSYDPDGAPLTYSWVQMGGPFNVTLTGANTATAALTPVLAGGVGGPYTFTFELTVSDTALSRTASVSVTVEQVNHAPTANAGPPRR